ncbi:MAG: NAD(P)H-dependent oxidoreductase subunit E [Proteobacteria bacterium]|nr:NAD(P)H-dependent oxidoreductase subunit E [Pseudomonadota bacterium]
MPALYIAQEELGHITEEAIEWVSERVGMAPVHVMEVATFYTMFYKKPVGKYHVQVCRTLSCALRGARKVTEHLHNKFGTAPGEVTPDGMWSYEEVECLGSCGSAPMCEINDHYFENLTVEKLDLILAKIAKEQPDLRLSTLRDDLGAGLIGHPKSEVI